MQMTSRAACTPSLTVSSDGIDQGGTVDESGPGGDIVFRVRLRKAMPDEGSDNYSSKIK
jgi:hypothetical protein